MSYCEKSEIVKAFRESNFLGNRLSENISEMLTGNILAFLRLSLAIRQPVGYVNIVAE